MIMMIVLTLMSFLVTAFCDVDDDDRSSVYEEGDKVSLLN